MTKVINATSSDFEQIVLKEKQPVLVDFWASWCVPCQMMGPILDDLSIDLDGLAKIVKVDIEDPENAELAMRYQVRGIPNMKIFKDGNMIKEIVGMRPKELLRAEMDTQLK